MFAGRNPDPARPKRGFQIAARRPDLEPGGAAGEGATGSRGDQPGQQIAGEPARPGGQVAKRPPPPASQTPANPTPGPPGAPQPGDDAVPIRLEPPLPRELGTRIGVRKQGGITSALPMERNHLAQSEGRQGVPVQHQQRAVPGGEVRKAVQRARKAARGSEQFALGRPVDYGADGDPRSRTSRSRLPGAAVRASAEGGAGSPPLPRLRRPPASAGCGSAAGRGKTAAPAWRGGGSADPCVPPARPRTPPRAAASRAAARESMPVSGPRGRKGPARNTAASAIQPSSSSAPSSTEMSRETPRFLHGDAIEVLAGLHRQPVVGDDHELGVLPELPEKGRRSAAHLRRRGVRPLRRAGRRARGGIGRGRSGTRSPPWLFPRRKGAGRFAASCRGVPPQSRSPDDRRPGGALPPVSTTDPASRSGNSGGSAPFASRPGRVSAPRAEAGPGHRRRVDETPRRNPAFTASKPSWKIRRASRSWRSIASSPSRIPRSTSPSCGSRPGALGFEFPETRFGDLVHRAEFLDLAFHRRQIRSQLVPRLLPERRRNPGRRFRQTSPLPAAEFALQRVKQAPGPGDHPRCRGEPFLEGVEFGPPAAGGGNRRFETDPEAFGGFTQPLFGRRPTPKPRRPPPRPRRAPPAAAPATARPLP